MSSFDSLSLAQDDIPVVRCIIRPLNNHLQDTIYKSRDGFLGRFTIELSLRFGEKGCTIISCIIMLLWLLFEKISKFSKKGLQYIYIYIMVVRHPGWGRLSRKEESL